MAKAKFEDDEDLTPTSKHGGKFEDDDVPAPTNSRAAGVPGKGNSFEEDEDNLDVQFGDEKLMRRDVILGRLRPEKGKAVRFAIVPGIPAKSAYTHFIDKKGTFRCLSKDHDAPDGVCCRSGKAQDAALTVVAVVVAYTNADSKTGKYEGKLKDADTEGELMHVALSRSNFRDISGLVQEEEKVEDFDIIMTHRENGIGYKFNRASRTARWTKDSEFAQSITTGAEKYADGKVLTSKLGRKLSVIEWKALLASLDGEAEDDGDGDGSNGAL
jgi:hypothetical protein